MARYTDSVCKLCRREGMKLFLKGERCLSPKCAVERRAFPPGMHGKKQTFRRKTSDYGTQLREKQKARRVYGVMERQFRKTYAIDGQYTLDNGQFNRRFEDSIGMVGDWRKAGEVGG